MQAVMKLSRRKAVTTPVAGAMLIVGLLIGAGLTYALTSSSSSSSMTETVTSTTTASAAGGSGLSGTITIGELTDLSGELEAIGTQVKTAQQLAINDINAYLPTIGVTDLKFSMISEDTGSNQ